MNSSGTVTAVNTFGATGLLSRHVTSGNASTFYAFDERGNVAQRTNSAGAVLSSDLYDGFGKLLAGGAAGDPWGFGAQDGYYTDTETGLLLCTHRFYDPQQGRWLTRDPMGYGGGVNLYGYVGNDPANVVDPSGLMPALALAGGGTLAWGAAPEAGAALAPLAGPIALGVGVLGIGYGLGTGATALGNHLADSIPAQDGLPADSPITRYKPYSPDRTLPRDGHGRSIPDSPCPHTQLGKREGRKGTYPQSREWGQDGQPGRPVRDTDWTNHGRPGIPGHTDPHEHPYGPGGERLPAQPLNPDGTTPE